MAAIEIVLTTDGIDICAGEWGRPRGECSTRSASVSRFAPSWLALTAASATPAGRERERRSDFLYSCSSARDALCSST